MVCLVGPTGSRKNDIARELVDSYGMEKPITATTRPPRADESNGNYRFLKDTEFIREMERGNFLETTVYSGYHFGTKPEEIDKIVDKGSVAVLPIDICGALTMKNKYRSRALLVFLRRGRYDVIRDIVSRDMDCDDMTSRILSLDDEYRNEELCDMTVNVGADYSLAARDIAEHIGRA